MTASSAESLTDDEANPRGRGIYFIHESTETLPIRNIRDEGKTEPHIEYGRINNENHGKIVGAENYCYECYQDAIKHLLKNDEEYLFLTTYPKHPDIQPKENHIVGYIRNEQRLEPEPNRLAVAGETRLYSFEDAIPAGEFGKHTQGGQLGPYGEKYDEDDTAEILSHFEACQDVTQECLEKVLELKRETNQSNDEGRGC